MWRVLIFISVAVIISLSCETVLDDWYADTPSVRPLEMKFTVNPNYSYIEPGSIMKLLPCGDKLSAVVIDYNNNTIYTYHYNGDDKNPMWYLFSVYSAGTAQAFDAVCYNNEIVFGLYKINQTLRTNEYQFMKPATNSATPIGSIDVTSQVPIIPEQKLAVYNGNLYSVYRIAAPGGSTVNIFKASKYDGATWLSIDDPTNGIHRDDKSSRSNLRLAADSSGMYALFTTSGSYGDTLNIRKYTNGWSDVIDNESVNIQPYYSNSIINKYELIVNNGYPTLVIYDHDSFTEKYSLSVKQIIPNVSKWIGGSYSTNTLYGLQILTVNDRLTVLRGDNSIGLMLGTTYVENSNSWQTLFGSEFVLPPASFHAAVHNKKLYIIFYDASAYNTQVAVLW